MFQLIVVPSTSTANTALTYDSKDNFDAAMKNFHDRMKLGGVLIVQEDDAGQQVNIQADNISYIIGIDVAKQKDFTDRAQMRSALKTEKPKFTLDS